MWGIPSRYDRCDAGTAVHPHVCGEYLRQPSILKPARGSPPRVWGIPDARINQMAVARFTPTCVGNTHQSCDHRQFVSVHPHVCGEYIKTGRVVTKLSRFTPTCVGNTICCKKYTQKQIGSPPRVWGILAVRAIPVVVQRFTPTCVGNTAGGEWISTVYRGSPPRVWGIPPCVVIPPGAKPVHPHVCGEYAARISLLWSSRRFTPTCVGNTTAFWPITSHLPGSPPRVWGIPSRAQLSAHRSRFTPTCVGNTDCNMHIDCHTIRFTPTCVGNTTGRAGDQHHREGSPPRVWGIHCVAVCSQRLERFTPTCVGNTTRRCPPPRCPAVHPHVCGEYLIPNLFTGWPSRFTPTCVGNTRAGDRGGFLLRFTPTCVGNTTSDKPMADRHTVHPHVCGEYQADMTDAMQAQRFTPTCVGNTSANHRS